MVYCHLYLHAHIVVFLPLLRVAVFNRLLQKQIVSKSKMPCASLRPRQLLWRHSYRNYKSYRSRINWPAALAPDVGRNASKCRVRLAKTDSLTTATDVQSDTCQLEDRLQGCCLPWQSSTRQSCALMYLSVLLETIYPVWPFSCRPAFYVFRLNTLQT